MTYLQIVVGMAAVHQAVTYSSHVSLKSLCENLDSQDSRRMWLQNYEVKETKDQFLCPFPHMATDREGVGHSVTFVDLTHMSIVILHNGWLQGISTPLTKVTFCWWITNI